MGGTDPGLDLADELVELERALATRDPSGVPGGFAALIAPEFVEFGQSGRVWDRDAIVDLLVTAGHPSVPLALEGAAVDRLADDVALVTYRIVAPGHPTTNRSSVWVRRQGRWLLRFHQGTRVTDAPAGG